MATAAAVDPRSGYCAATSTFLSKRAPLPLPAEDFLDIATFIRSRPHSGHVALIDAATGSRLTYSDLWHAVDAVAAALSVRHGVRKGQVVLLLSPNSILFPVALIATLSLGAVVTTTNPLNTPAEIRKQAADSRPVLAFTVRALLPKLAGSGLPVVLLDESDDGARPDGVDVVSTIGEMLKSDLSRRKVHDHGAGAGAVGRERVRQDDTATLLYSSGTTGMSKGVASTHRNLIAMVQTILQRFRVEEGSQTFICTVPMFHVYGLAAFGSGLLASGSTIVVLNKFELDHMLDTIAKYGVTNLPLVPPILVAMSNHAAAIRAKYDLSTLRTVLSGGAPLSKEVIEGFLAEFPGIQILQGYGLTESTAIGASTDSMEESLRYGTAGLISPNMQAKIVDPDSGRALGVNQTGELWLSGPTIMKGYFSNPEATASTLDSSGWLRTGDVCYIDEDGFIFVVDRLKELIKYKGYQVAPAELEALLLTHPEINDAAVIPYPDKKAGQVPMAYVVRKDGCNLSHEAVMHFVAKQVAPYKRVRRVAFVTTIPKNPSGKILRKDLIQMAASKL